MINRYTRAKLADLGEAATKMPEMIASASSVKPPSLSIPLALGACESNPTDSLKNKDLRREKGFDSQALTSAGDSSSEQALVGDEPVSELAALILEVLENQAKQGNLAERAGFEPAVGFYPHAALAKQRVAIESAEISSVLASPRLAYVPADVLTASDPDLARVIAAWPTLADPIKRALLALVGTASEPHSDSR